MGIEFFIHCLRLALELIERALIRILAAERDHQVVLILVHQRATARLRGCGMHVMQTADWGEAEGCADIASEGIGHRSHLRPPTETRHKVFLLV